jgi:hypothetical protein
VAVVVFDVPPFWFKTEITFAIAGLSRVFWSDAGNNRNKRAKEQERQRTKEHLKVPRSGQHCPLFAARPFPHG